MKKGEKTGRRRWREKEENRVAVNQPREKNAYAKKRRHTKVEDAQFTAGQR